MPIVGTIRIAVDALADLGTIREVLATNVAQQMIQMPLHHKRADVVPYHEKLKSKDSTKDKKDRGKGLSS